MSQEDGLILELAKRIMERSSEIRRARRELLDTAERNREALAASLGKLREILQETRKLVAHARTISRQALQEANRPRRVEEGSGYFRDTEAPIASDASSRQDGQSLGLGRHRLS
jgi:hypothetical protein